MPRDQRKYVMWSTVLWGRSLPVYFTYVLCLYKTIGFQTISTRLIEVDINDVKLVTYFIFIFRILTFYVLGNDEYSFRHITTGSESRGRMGPKAAPATDPA